MATLQERYFNDCKKLIMTLRIKSTLTAELMNEDIERRYGPGSVLLTEPQTWKYYLNMCGEPHHSDVPMEITSLDTQEPIYFTKENLKVHTATAEAYQYGTRYFYSLLAKYPQQEFLIFGILYPADMATLLSARDHTIVAYDRQFVEPQEQTLIYELQEYIYRHQHRWLVVSFSSSDNLYPAAQLGILYLNLLCKLQLLRLARCHTDEAHSFHIRQYLASNGRLDRFMTYMTLKQQLWLYRNLRYIQRHTGVAEQFWTLIEKLFTDRNIPVSEYTIRYQNGFDDELYNRVRVRAKSINPQYNVPEVQYLSVDKLHEEEARLVYGNPAYQAQHIPRMNHMLKTRSSTVTLTKDLGSAMVDYSDAVPDTLTMIRIRQWAYMSNHGLYRAYINFKDPVTSEPISLPAKEAFVFYLYLWTRVMGFAQPQIPQFQAWRYQRHPLPSLNDLMSVTDPAYERRLLPYAEAMLARRPKATGVTSVKSFNTLCRQMFDASYLDWVAYSNEGDGYMAAQIRNLAYRVHGVKQFKVSPHTRFDTWAKSLDLTLPDYALPVMESYLLTVYRAAVGHDSNVEITLGDIQRAMTQIMLQLSSYSIQFITSINDSAVEVLNWAATRIADQHIASTVHDAIMTDVVIVDSSAHSDEHVLLVDTVAGTSSYVTTNYEHTAAETIVSSSYVGTDNSTVVAEEILGSQHTLELNTD